MATPSSTTNLRLTRFPPEIDDFIIDLIGYGEDDGKAAWLHSCSLVCSSWEYRARPHILRVVRLGNIDHVRGLLDALLRKPHYRSFIKTLKLRCPERDHLSESEKKALDIDSTAWLSRAIIALPTLLPNLHRLELHRLPGPEMMEKSFTSYFGNFKNIRSLRLEHLTEQTCYEIVRIINEFPDLRSLEISDCSWTQFGRPGQLKQRRLSEVYLDLRPDFERIMSAWMSRSDSLSTLRSLTWRSNQESSSQFLELLAGCANTLREATMTIDFPEDHHPQVPPLGKHEVLESFTLDVRQPLSDDVLYYFAEVMIDLPMSVRTVRLICNENFNDVFIPPGRLHWELLFLGYEQSNLSDIQRLEIYSRYPQTVDYTQIDEYLRGVLDRLYLRGVVWCVHRLSETSGLLHHKVMPNLQDRIEYLRINDPTFQAPG
ncbi:hypothetical protein NLI96_g2203 [Meripilus lineatus]|uniref:Uncharacterized protein n=1 Tax=Meripilus lineatus TaxID=2056292 RepID=A0AAD5V960_9APHY|nr:hypothetical protein NLI96_g2203 [Physisporinus lineatus]